LRTDDIDVQQQSQHGTPSIFQLCQFRNIVPLNIKIAPVLFMLLAAGCGNRDAGKSNQPPEIGFVVVHPVAVPVTTELSGRVTAFASSEVRPQVSGIVRRRLFTEGAIVRAGQTLYQIDPSLYRATLSQAEANLASAQANVEAVRSRAERYRPLAEMEAVSRQDYTDAAAQARQAAATVQQSRAQLETARINLNYTRVPAPITGRIGRSLFTQGALVTADQASPLAVIQQLDPIYVDIQQSSSELVALRRAIASGGFAAGSADVRLKLEDGSDYELPGRIEFSEAIVDPDTGTVTLRGRFPNPKGVLLPGMFVRTMLTQAVNQQAFLVPQQGVMRDPRGNATVMVVADNKAVERKITTQGTSGSNWIVTAGLKSGDRVITEGTGKVIPNQPVRPVPAGSPQKLSPTRNDHAAPKANAG
jgi:membrane fusion protein, multidrug efflux system